MMTTSEHASCKRHDDRGVSILIIAVSMIFILGMAGLGIDLASLYVARSQSQRAADAAALAAAHYLAANDCLSASGGGLSGTCQALAKQQAEAVGDQNLIAGVSPNLQDSDITFLDTSSTNPRIQVIAGRSTMPTFFVKIFGINTASVSAKALAEAYTSSGSGPAVGARCVKPWLIPNCDPGNSTVFNSPDPCPPNVGGFVTVQQGSYASTLSRGDTFTPSGAKGEPFTLKPGSPGDTITPGQYYAAYIPNDTTFPTQCPDCANGGGGGGAGTGSAAVYRSNIECCNNNAIVCGPQQITLQSTAGNMVGPTRQGVDCLIHQSGSNWSSNCGQDTLAGGYNPPCVGNPPPSITTASGFKITAGPNYPYGSQFVNTQIDPTMSDSIVVLPIWDGAPLQSGQNPSILVVGFLKLFIQNEDPNNQGTVYGTVMSVTTCGSGGSGSTGGGNGGPIIAPGGSTVPVRLIHE